MMDKLGRDNPDYNYVYASQILAAFREELFKRDILLLPNDLELTEKEVPTLPGVMLNRVTIKVEYEFRDAWNREASIIKTAFGSGIDGGDKALYIAKTGSVKYLFRVLGMIPWNETDPEANLLTADLTNPKTYASPADKKKRRLADRQVRAFDSMCHQTGKTAQQVADYLQIAFSVKTVADLPPDEFNEAMKWATQSSDLKQQLQESLVAANAKKNGSAAKVEGMPEQIAGD